MKKIAQLALVVTFLVSTSTMLSYPGWGERDKNYLSGETLQKLFPNKGPVFYAFGSFAVVWLAVQAFKMKALNNKRLENRLECARFEEYGRLNISSSVRML